MPNNLKDRTTRILEKLKEELITIRTSRPTPALVENIAVEYYGEKMPLKQVGSISIKPPREIQIQAWDKEGATAIAKALDETAKKSSHSSATAEGQLVRVFLPELSTERREELSKHIKKIVEEHRIQIRTAREETNKEIDSAEKQGELTEDDKFQQKEEIQKETEEINKEVDEILERKLAEINE
ncbi:ribosome recycling factor [bacterium]|nr:ribosome recycling factor [bacterium]|tara:strand:- start:1818 stop:2369 length:552 start_codon:yes stop_codon:yes gene_type:complete